MPTPIDAARQASVVALMPDGFMRNAQGHLVPLDLVKPVDQERDRLVRELVLVAQDLNAKLVAAKGRIFGDVAAFAELSAEQYGVKRGGQVIPFPKDLRRELTRLELEIYGKFLGDNYDDLARQYDMTMSGMRKLIARIRAKLAADVQNDLFDPIRAA